jgi:hypothetical protein
LDKSDWKLIEYEDFCSNPSKTKSEIADFLGLTIVSENNSDVILKPFESHTIQGNPIRLLKKEVKIIFDERWKKRLTADQIRQINIIQSITTIS